MRSRKILLLAVALLLGIASSAAFADRGRHRSGHGHHHRGAHFGFFIGAPLFYPWGYPAPYYYQPPVVVVPATPPTYIEQADERGPVGQAEGYWYYCPDSKAYYPYVRQCPTEWQRVAPRPAS